MSPNRNEQAGPAIALVQLLMENPGLPGLFWTIHPDGYLSGAISQTDIDVRPVLAAYQGPLGGTIRELRYTRKETGVEWYSAILDVVWRDIRFRLSVGCPAAVLAEAAQIAMAA